MSNKADHKKIKHLRSLNFTDMYSPIQMYEAYKDIDGYRELLESNDAILEHIYGLNEDAIQHPVFSLHKEEKNESYGWSIVYNINDLKEHILLGLHKQLISKMEMLGYRCSLPELREKLHKRNPHKPYLIIDQFPDTSYPPYARLSYFNNGNNIPVTILPIVEVLLNIHDKESNILGETAGLLNQPIHINEMDKHDWVVNKHTMLIDRKTNYNYEKFETYADGMHAEYESTWDDRFTPVKREYNFFKSFGKLNFIDLPPVKREFEYNHPVMYYRDMDQVAEDLYSGNMMPIQLAGPIYRSFLHTSTNHRSFEAMADMLFKPQSVDAPNSQLKMVLEAYKDYHNYNLIFMVNSSVGIHQRICDLLRFSFMSKEFEYFVPANWYLYYGLPKDMKADMGVMELTSPTIIIESMGVIRPQSEIEFTFLVERPTDTWRDLDKLRKFADNLEDYGKIGIISRKGSFNVNKRVYKVETEAKDNYWYLHDEVCLVTSSEAYSPDMKGLIEAALYEDQYMNEFLHVLLNSGY